VSTATALDWLADAGQKQRAEAEAHWRDLVVLVADNEPPDDPIAARRTLTALGKSDTDLRAAADLLRRRRVWAAEVAAGPPARERMNAVNVLIAKADAVLAEARRVRDAAVGPLVHELCELDAVLSRARMAPHELFRSCTDPKLIAVYQKAQEEKAAAQEQSLDFKRQANAADARAREVAATAVLGELGRGAADKLARFEAEAAGHRELAEQWIKKATALGADVDRAAAAMCEP